jgi:large subunit ribosomal protein L24
MKLKKGDKVIVITGKDKGKSGVIERALPSVNKVIVGGINMHKAHQKPRRAGDKGQTVERTMPMNASNVMLVESNKRVRTTIKTVDGKKVRVSRKSGNAI